MQRLGSGLAGLIRGLGLEDQARLHGIKARWRELLGVPLSENLEPGFVSGATLHIAGSPLWIEQAGFYRDEILKRLSPLGIKDLKFKPGPLVKKADRPSQAKNENPPLSGEETLQVEVAVQQVRDDELKRLCRGIMGKAIVRERQSSNPSHP
ncbi:MAG: DciA family protein [Nitrospiraceae bacterium]|nr:DciA family protein [Nitrospiraceae bacterium]